jgi:hypothetical protein
MPAHRASTEEDAASLALSLLAEPGLASMLEDSKAGRETRKWFGTVRDALLQREDWNFADGETQPAPDVVEGLGKLKKRYPLPADCLQVRSVDDLGPDQWVVRAAAVDQAGVALDAKVLCTDAGPPIVVRYTRMIVEVRLWSPLFLVMFAEGLAKQMGRAYGVSSAEIEQRAGELRELFGVAARRDARERSPTMVTQDTSWLRARRGSWRR